MAKMGHPMIVLCAAAIGIIYTTGYFVTEPAQVSLAQTAPASISVVHNNSFSTSNGAGNNSSSQGTSGSAAATRQSQYRDGTYYGQGSNRIGTVEVAVTVSQGKIAVVEITRCSTHYPQSYIDPILPQEVVQTQSANVDVVSGATRSSEDFAAAVQQALGQAQA